MRNLAIRQLPREHGRAATAQTGNIPAAFQTRHEKNLPAHPAATALDTQYVIK